MGANFDYRIYSADKSKIEISAHWGAAVEDSLYSGGHEYSGEIGMLGHDIRWRDDMEPFESEDDAEKWLIDNHEKWECGMAVQFKDGSKIKWMIGGWCSS